MHVKSNEGGKNNDVNECAMKPICQPSIKLNIPNATSLPTKTSQERWMEAYIDKPNPPLLSGFIPVEKSTSNHKTSDICSTSKFSASQVSENTIKKSAIGSLRSRGNEFITHPVRDFNFGVQNTYHSQMWGLQQKLMAPRTKITHFPVSSGHQHREIINRECVYVGKLHSRWQSNMSIPSPRVLSADELRPDFPWLEAWSNKKNMREKPSLNGDNKGMQLLQSMGWKSGEGLGKENQGPVEPLDLKLKLDRKGLGSNDDNILGKKKSVVMKDGRNPVSVLQEYCQKKHVGMPLFTCMEVGPPNKKGFLCRAIFNGVEYEPSLSSSNKKAAKAQVCMVVLKAISCGFE